MKVLLTGATGFLGSHLLKAMIKTGHEVTILKRVSSDITRIVSEIDKYHSFDVPETPLKTIFSTYQFDAVCHCATVYGREGAQTSQVLEGNLLFPIDILENAIQNGCKYFVNTDTFFCKQLPNRLHHNEPIYMPDYTLTKHQFQEWGHLRANQGSINFINLRMEHIYGPNDSLGKFVPWVESQLQNNAPSLELTDGIQIRDFVYVDDVVDVFLDILKKIHSLRGFISYDVGSGQAVSVRQFVENMKERMQASTQLNFGSLPRREEEIMYSKASSNSPYAMINFKSAECK